MQISDQRIGGAIRTMEILLSRRGLSLETRQWLQDELDEFLADLDTIANPNPDPVVRRVVLYDL